MLAVKATNVTKAIGISITLRHCYLLYNYMYCFHQVNDADVIQYNIKEILRLAAVKFCYLTDFLPDENALLTKRSKKIWSGEIEIARIIYDSFHNKINVYFSVTNSGQNEK